MAGEEVQRHPWNCLCPACNPHAPKVPVPGGSVRQEPGEPNRTTGDQP